MACRHIEHRGDLPLLGALAHQPGIAARAERKREGIEQDRLAGTGLAGEHRKSLGEIEIELVDQDDVANGQTDEHDDVFVTTGMRPGRRIRRTQISAVHVLS